VLWMLGGRIKLEFPVAAVSVGDELGSKAEGAWGATRSMFVQCCLLLIRGGECLLRSVSKPVCDGFLFGFGFDGGGRSWRFPAVTVGISGIFLLQMVQGPCCNFHFSKGPL
jgi:hypothetical protein